MNGGNSLSTSYRSISRADIAFAEETSCCGCVLKTWPANAPKLNRDGSTCWWALMTTTPAVRAVWWRTRAACSSRGRTCGPVGSGNSSSVTRGASAREKHGGKTERSGEKERKIMTRATSEQIDWRLIRTVVKDNQLWSFAFCCLAFVFFPSRFYFFISSILQNLHLLLSIRICKVVYVWSFLVSLYDVCLFPQKIKKKQATESIYLCERFPSEEVCWRSTFQSINSGVQNSGVTLIIWI